MYVNNDHKTHVQDKCISKEKKKIHKILTTSLNVHSSLNKNLLY